MRARPHISRRSRKGAICVLAVLGVLVSAVPPVPVWASQRTADSLAAYWKFDETSGTSAADASGDGRTGTLTNGPSISTDVPSLSFTDGRSLSFDGNDDYVDGGNVGIGGATSKSVSLWIKTSAAESAGLFDAGTINASNQAFALYVVGANVTGGSPPTDPGGVGFVGWGNDIYVPLGIGAVADGQWHNVTMTYDAGTTKGALYFDGAASNGYYWDGAWSSSQAQPITFSALNTSSQNALIGKARTAFFSAGDEEFNGLIDDVRVYARALAPWEITELAAGRHVPAYWNNKVGTAFERARNWSGSYVPDPYSRIILPNTATGALTLTGAIKVAGLTIGTGRTLRLNGTGITMNDGGTFTHYGTLTLKNTETVSGLTVPTDKGLVVLAGTGSTTGLQTGNSYNRLALSDGLVGYWKFDESVASRAADSSGYNNSGSVINGAAASFTVPPVRFPDARSLSFDGSNDYVNAGTGIRTWAFDKLTMAAWIKTNTVSGEQGIISHGSSGNGVTMALISGQIACWFPGLGIPTRSPVLTVGAWTHVACTHTYGSTVQMYVNGVSVVNEAYTDLPRPTTAYLGIGNQYNGMSGRYFNGLLDDVRIYDRVLSPSEVASLASGNPSASLGTVTLNSALDVNHDLTLASGTLDASSSNYGITVGGSFLDGGGLFVPRKGTVTLDGTLPSLRILSGGARFNNLTLNGVGATWRLGDRLTASGTLTLTSGTLDASGSNVIRAGTWTQAGGTFTPRSGTVVLTNPGDAILTPSSAFNALRVEDPTENGLAGYWKLDEGTNSGSILDSSPGGASGVRRGTGSLVWTGSTLASSIAFDDAYAMQFNGATDYAEFSDAAALTSNAFSFCAWFKWDGRRYTAASTRDWGTIASKGQYNSGEFAFLFNRDSSSSNNSIGFYINNGSRTSTTITGGAGTTWHHLCGTYDQSLARLYVDGAATSSGAYTAAVSDTANALRLGAETGSPARFYFWGGALDDARYYNRTLSADEVMNLARGRYAAGDSGTSTVTLAGNLSAATLALDSGNLTLSSYDATVTNALSLLRGNGALTAGAGTLTLNGGLTVSGSTLTGGAGTIDINGNVVFLTGALVASSGNMTLSGDWKKTGGYFTPNNGTLVLDGANQTFTGSLAMKNFTKIVSSAARLTLSSGAVLTVSGALVLQGAASNLLTLRTATGGSAHGLVLGAAGSQTIDHVDVKDSNAAGGQELVCYASAEGCVDAGGTTNWKFADPAAAPSGGGEESAGGGGAGGGGGGRRGSTQQMSTRITEARMAIAGRFEQLRAAAREQEAVPARTVARRERETVSASASSSAAPAVALSYPYVTASREHVALVLAANRSVVYQDVPMDAWFAPYVADLVENDVARGYADEQGTLKGQFGVSDPVTFAEMLKMALEAAGKADTLPDLAPANRSARGTWAAPYVRQAEDLNLTVFRKNPDMNAPATRGEVVQTLLEVLGFPIAKTVSMFSDVPASHPYSPAIALAAFNGFVEGDRGPDGQPLNTFRPDANINRAEVAKIIALAREVVQP